MEFRCLLFLVMSSRMLMAQSHESTKDTDWSDVVVTKVGRAVTLPCVDWPLMGSVPINWNMKPAGTDRWKLVISADVRKQDFGPAAKTSMRLVDSHFAKTGNFSLLFVAKMEDTGRYSCVINQKERKLRKVIMLVVLAVTVLPPVPVSQNSTLRLKAQLSPHSAVSEVTWLSPGGTPLRLSRISGGVVSKLPQIRPTDQGIYICQVYPRGNSSTRVFLFNVDITVDGSKAFSFTNKTNNLTMLMASLTQVPLTLTCYPVQGDYVLLYWRPPDNRISKTTLIYGYDRWRDQTKQSKTHAQLSLDGLLSPPEEGFFSFTLRPQLNEAGCYTCVVYLDDVMFIQTTLLSILQVNTRHYPSSMLLTCQYAERSQLKQVHWRLQNNSRILNWRSSAPGHLSTEVHLPPTEETAGNYTCVMELKNGAKVEAVYTITLPPKVNTESPGSVSPPFSGSNDYYFSPTLSALLLLGLLVAAVAGVLLWRQKGIPHHSVEQSLSHYSGEVENIYENPEHTKQVFSQSSVYMDLKPREDDDVYKELDLKE